MKHSFNDIILKIGKREIYASDFSAGSFDGWSAKHSAATLDHGSADDLGWQFDTASTSHYISRPIDFVAGKKYKLTGKTYIYSGQATDGLKIMTSTTNDVIYDCYSSSVGGDCVHDEWKEFSVEFTAESSSDGIYIFGVDGGTGSYAPGSSDRIWIIDFVLTELSGEIYASSVDIGANVQIGGRNSIIHSSSSDYFSSSPTKGEINASYYLTGVDPLVDLIKNPAPVGLEVGGFVVNSGYLGKYEFHLKQYDPINVSVTFAFFEKPKGSFAVGSSTLPDNRYFLSTADVSLDDETYISPNQIKSLSYTYTSEISPKIVVEEEGSSDSVALKDVVHGVSKVDVSMDTYNYDVSLPASGIASEVKINLRDEHGNKKLKFDVNGVARSLSINVSAGSEISQKVNIAQGNIGGAKPSLSSPAIAETTAMPGDSLSIFGSDLQDVDKVSFMGFRCEITSKNSSSVQIIVPYNVPNSGTAPFIAHSPAGQSISSTSLMVTGDGTLDLF